MTGIAPILADSVDCQRYPTVCQNGPGETSFFLLALAFLLLILAIVAVIVVVVVRRKRRRRP